MGKKLADASSLVRRARIAQVLIIAERAVGYLRPEDVVASVSYKKILAWTIKGGSSDKLLVYGRTLEAELRRAEVAHQQMPAIEASEVNASERAEAHGPIYRLALINILAMCLEYACGGEELTFSHVQEYLDEIPENPCSEETTTLFTALENCLLPLVSSEN